MIEPGNCAADIQVGSPLAGFATVQCHTDANQHGECWLQVTRADGSTLNDGDGFVPGETLGISMESECMGMALGADATCSEYGREVLIELEGQRWGSGAGSRGCSNTRIINPFRTPTINAPASGSLTIRGGVGYCYGAEVNGVVTSTCSDEFHVAAEITLTAGGAGPSPPSSDSSTTTGDSVDAVVTASATSMAGMDTYTFTARPKGTASNIYTIFGSLTSDMVVPPAYQEAAPFGANTGGVAAAFAAVVPTAAFDSWLTVGVTDGDAAGALSSIGIDWSSWTETSGISTNDGAVFWMSPDRAPSLYSTLVRVAQRDALTCALFILDSSVSRSVCVYT